MKCSKRIVQAALLLSLAPPGVARAAERMKVGLMFGQTTTLMTSKSVAVLASCTQGEGDPEDLRDVLRVYATTTVADSYTEGSPDHDGFQGNYLQPGMSPADSGLLVNGVPTGEQSLRNDIDDGYVVAPDGSMIFVEGETAVLAVNPVFSEFDCLVSVNITRRNQGIKAAKAGPVGGGPRKSAGLVFGQTTTLLTNKSVAVLASCTQAEGDPGEEQDVVRVYATTQVADSYTEGSPDHDGFQGNYLQPGMLPADSGLLVAGVATGEQSIRNDPDDGYVVAPDWNMIFVEGETAVLAVNPAFSEFDCLVSVDMARRSRAFKAAK
jgi:hypothetical protein